MKYLFNKTLGKQKDKQHERGFALLEVLLAGLIGAVVVTTVAVQGSGAIKRYEARKNTISTQDRALLRTSIVNYLDRYKNTCFGSTVHLGDKAVFLAAFDKVPIGYDKDPAAEKRLAAFQGGAIFLSEPVREENGKLRKDLDATVWHELVHVVEQDNWDKWTTHLSNDEYNERHTEYAESRIVMLDLLKKFEQDVRAKKDPKTLAKRWQRLVQMGNEGSTNNFEKIPSDLSKFETYAGFRVDISDITTYYRGKQSCIKIPKEVFGPDPIPEPTDIISTIPEVQPEDTDKPEGTTEPTGRTYIVWDPVNAHGIGLQISSKTGFEAKDEARDYDGGGVTPGFLVEKKQIIPKEFASYEDARVAVCGQLTEFGYFNGWPRAKWTDGENRFLGNFRCPEQQN